MLIEKTTDPKGLAVLKDLVHEMNFNMRYIEDAKEIVRSTKCPIDELPKWVKNLEQAILKFDMAEYYARFLAKELGGYKISVRENGWYDLEEVK